MFTQDGYAATSTRAVAAGVGIKQASLYYHFPSKDDILAELLSRTVRPSLAFAEQSAAVGGAPEIQLYALVHFDVRLMCSGPWNLGALYLLPEVRNERFAGFRAERRRLRMAYLALVQAGCSAGSMSTDEPEVATGLIFALAESVITLRWENTRLEAAALGDAIATGSLRLVNVRNGRIPAIARAGAALVAEAGSGVEALRDSD